MDRSASPGGIFYGWIIVAVVFLIMVTTAGIGFYNASVILSAAIDELNASVGSVSGATGLFFALAGLSGFAVSKWMDTVDIRLFFLAGGIVGAVALYGLRWVDSVPALYLFFALFGVGFGVGGLVAGTTLVTRWFDRRRSVALSIASSGLSVGGIVVTPFAARLIEDRGLADAGTLLALAWLVGVIPLAMLALRSDPSAVGLATDGDPIEADPKEADPINGDPIEADPIGSHRIETGGINSETAGRGPRPSAAVGVPFLEARRTRFFVAVCAAYAFIFFGQVGALAQLYNMVRERTDAGTAATCLSVVALSSVIARLIGGVVVIKLPTKAFTVALAALQAVALFILAQSATANGLIAGSVVMGASIGNLLMLQPLLLAETFGVVNYSRIYSLSQLIATIGVAGGPLGLGIVRDLVDYHAAFLLAAASTTCGLIALLGAGPVDAVRSLWQATPPRPGRGATEPGPASSIGTAGPLPGDVRPIESA